MRRSEQIPYGVKDFKRIRLENRYYVDKTAFIRKMEARADFLFFVRPRRFGKSLLCETLRCYYDVAEKENFARLFGDLDIGKNPTKNANRYFVLSLDFSQVSSDDGATWSAAFRDYIDQQLDDLIEDHATLLAEVPGVKAVWHRPGPARKYAAIVKAAKRLGYGIYVIVDEYDNFTNEIVATLGAKPYKKITHGTGFYRGWFKKFKSTCERIFMTGVSPVTLDDLTSGFNIATNISLDEEFHGMVGFTTDETRRLFEDFQGVGKFTGDVAPHLRTVKAWYDSYCFSKKCVGKESLYNCDMALYYLSQLVATGEPPDELVDGNIRSDWSKLHLILDAQHQAEVKDGVLPLTEELADKGEATFELVKSFPIEEIANKANFKSLYYYYGIVTMGRIDFDETYYRVPNECIRRQIFEYMRSVYAKDANPVDLEEFLRLFRGFARDGEWRPLFAYLAEKYRVSGSVRDGIDGEARINGFIRAYLTMKSHFLVRPELEQNGGFSDYALFPDLNAGPATPRHSYVIELKHSKADASDAEIAKKHEEALEQLKKYSEDPNLAALAAGTPVHFLCYEFKGRELVRLEEVGLK